jgi:hypothetical protein
MKQELLVLVVILVCTLPALAVLFGRLPGASPISKAPRGWRIAALGSVVALASLVIAWYSHS